MHQINFLAKKFRHAQRQHHKLVEQKNAIYGELREHQALTLDALQSHLKLKKIKAVHLRENLNSVSVGLEGATHKLKEIKLQIGSSWNPMNWFSSSQKEAESKCAALETRVRNLTQKKASYCDELKEVSVVIEKLEAEIVAHRNFDVANREAKLLELDAEANLLLERMETLRPKMLEVEQAIAPLMVFLKENVDAQDAIKNQIAEAEDFEEQLENASNGYERKLVHEACEIEFGEGSPGKVVYQLQNRLRKLNFDYEKMYKRASDKARQVARIVHHVVVDGNNLCYRNSEFIGTEALLAILPKLKERYAVTLIFDHSIVGNLNRSEIVLRKELEAWAQVHVAAPYEQADQTILDYASQIPFSVVLSNDQFADFLDKEVVRKRRVLRHEIVGKQIMVHDLELHASFERVATE